MVHGRLISRSQTREEAAPGACFVFLVGSSILLKSTAAADAAAAIHVHVHVHESVVAVMIR